MVISVSYKIMLDKARKIFFTFSNNSLNRRNFPLIQFGALDFALELDPLFCLVEFRLNVHKVKEWGLMVVASSFFKSFFDPSLEHDKHFFNF